MADISSLISQGTALVTTGLSVAKATQSVVNGISNILSGSNNSKSGDSSNLPNVIPNPLENFASYTPVWTLACLEPKQFNNPTLYRNSTADLKHIVLSSAGRFDSQRAATAYGVPEYYINNFQMKSVIGANKKTGNTNAVKFEWDIYEPYSMGLLLQSLQVSAQNAGYLNYLNNAPYVLRLDFMGFDELGKPYTSIKPKFFVLGLTSVKFTVNEGGSTYKMEAIPYNHKGFSDTVNVAFNDIKIAAGDKGTVEEMLTGENKESLTGVLNGIEQGLVKDKQIQYADVYEIQFPKTSDSFSSQAPIKGVTTATADPKASTTGTTITGTTVQAKVNFDTNDIGGASLGFDQSKGGNFVMKKNDTRDEKTGLINRDKMTIDPKKRVFQFAQGQSLTSIINQIILSSDYAKKAINPENTVDGFIKWFRLDVQVELLEYDDWIGDNAKKFIYRVVPFLVHESIFTNPNTAIPYEKVKEKICKGYNYIYTGQNVDLIKFDININNLFFTGIAPSTPGSAGQASDPNTAGATTPLANTQAKVETGSAPGAQVATTGRPRLKRDPSLIQGNIKGGSNAKDTELAVAQAFHKAFTSSNTEMVTCNLEILGDPYWIVDSGFANYFATPNATNPGLTEDGTMNYESGDVFVYLTFKTPVDVNENTGMMDYPYGGSESPFSGVYRVNSCDSKFSEGTFKQTLGCIRMPGQATDYKNLPDALGETLNVIKKTAGAYRFGPPEPPKTSVTDDQSGYIGGDEGE